MIHKTYILISLLLGCQAMNGHATDIPLSLNRFLPTRTVKAETIAGLIHADRWVDSLTWSKTVDQLSRQGGGVLTFGAGTYYFGYDLLLPDGVIIKGETPTKRLKNGRLVLSTEFAFPRFEGSAAPTPRFVQDFKASQLKRIYTARNAHKIGLLYVTINRAVLDLANVLQKERTEHRQVWLQGITLNNSMALDPAVPSAFQKKKDHGWQRWGRRDVASITVGVGHFCHISDCVINGTVTDEYVQNNYLTDDGMLFDGTQARLLYTDHPGIALYTTNVNKSILDVAGNVITTASTAHPILLNGSPAFSRHNRWQKVVNQNWVSDGIQATDQRYNLLYTSQYPSEAHTYTHDTGDTLPYRFIKPDYLKPQEKYPVVLYLHDYFEAGNDNRQQLRQFVWQLVQPNVRANYPCFIVAPQLPATEGNWRSEAFSSITWPLQASMNLLDSLARQYPIDLGRVYVVGINMGGEGVYSLATWYPNQIAAALPISTSYRLTQFSAQEAAKVPAWIVFGDSDEWFGSFTKQMMKTYYRLAGTKYHYTSVKNAGHRCWNQLLSEEPALLPWLFSQRKQF